MDAPSRDAVFAALREKGIKAIKVVAADGSKANGEIRGVRKRVVASVSALAAVLAGVVVYFALTDGRKDLPENAATPLPRQEIQGDRARIEAAAKSLPTAAERFLARFAEPGRPFAAPECDWPRKADFEAVLDAPLTFSEDEFTEQIDLKRMVEFLKQELRGYLRGGGLVSGYIKDLMTRQQMEIDEREKGIAELQRLLKEAQAADADRAAVRRKHEAAYDYWLRLNARLQSMGVFAVEQPRQLLYRQ